MHNEFTGKCELIGIYELSVHKQNYKSDDIHVPVFAGYIVEAFFLRLVILISVLIHDWMLTY